MKTKLTNYRFVVREIIVKGSLSNPNDSNRVLILGIKDKNTGLIFPHPLTDFIRIKYEYMGKSLNTQTIPAYIVCRFLNYVYDQIDSNNKEFSYLINTGMKGLKRLHASFYISSLTDRGLKHSTVLQTETALTHFYIYLKEMSLIHDFFEIEYRKNERGKHITSSLFRHSLLPTKLPSKRSHNRRPAKLKDFGKNRYELTIHFIQIARIVAPEIALGICLQFYGGLRRGEVVNITRGDILASANESLVVQIQDNRDILFSHLKDTKNEYPKRLNYLSTQLSKQTILDNDLIWEVYNEHIQMLNNIYKNQNIKNHFALFLDNDGKAMSGKVYELRFKKVKKHFISSLLENARFEEHALFSETYWGTHIGRGIFTNFLFDMGLSITQIAIARGDRSIESALEYVDEKVTVETIKNAMNELNKMSAEEIGLLEKDLIKKLWKEGPLKNGKKFSYYYPNN